MRPVQGWFDSTLPPSTDLQNDEPNWYRPMSVREGIYNSINTATFASLAGLNDFCDVQRAADAIGLHLGDGNDKKIDLSTLGNILGSQNVAPLTMANAFATFAADGTYCAPISIAEVDNAQGKRIGGQASACQPNALKPDVAKATTNVLQDVLTKGSGLLIPQKLGVPDAAKTGTNQYNNQTWVLGYTKGLATASFFGDPFNGGLRGSDATSRSTADTTPWWTGLHRRPTVGAVHAAGRRSLRPRRLRRPAAEPHQRLRATDPQQQPGHRRDGPGPGTATDGTPAPDSPVETRQRERERLTPLIAAGQAAPRTGPRRAAAVLKAHSVTGNAARAQHRSAPEPGRRQGMAWPRKPGVLAHEDAR
ncbi:penicillin-binding protein 1A [Arthrobacter sp. Hiyo8]|nr:penicillin-binding protein 1A [Arthrobacter sp. Hiyo8]